LTKLSISSCQLQAGDVEAITSVSTLRELSLKYLLYQQPFDYSEYSGLVRLKYLKSLSILPCNVLVTFDDTLLVQNLTRITNLVDLRIHSDQLGDAAFAKLCNNIKTTICLLDVSRCRNISRNGLVHLSLLEKLKSLNINQISGVDDSTLTYVKDLPCLKVLRMSLTQVGRQGIPTKLPPKNVLTYLDVSSTRLCDDDVAKLCRMYCSLHTLKLGETRLTGEGVFNFFFLRSLTALDLGFTGVTNDSLRHIGTLGKLEKLCLCYTLVSDEGFSHLRKLSLLTYLNIADTNISSSSIIKYIRNMVKLEVLNLYDIEVGDNALRCVADLHCLRELSLDQSAVSDAGVGHLGTLMMLKQLHLRGNVGVTDQSLIVFRKLASLKYIDVRDTSVSYAGIACLRKSRILEMDQAPMVSPF